VSAGVGIVAFIVMLLLAVLIHEAAHFTFAKIYDFKVEEFFVGFGPRLWSRRRGETEYGVKAIPAGGYVKIAGMNPFQPTPPEDLPRSYGAKPIRQRAVVIAAGPATHFVLALIFAALALGIMGTTVDRATFVGIAPTLNGARSPAAAAGLHKGDVVAVMSAGASTVREPTVEQFGTFVRAHAGEPISLTIDRAGAVVHQAVTPVLTRDGGREQPRIGVVVSPEQRPVGVLAAVTGAPGEVWRLTRASVGNMARVFGPDGVARIGRLLFTNAQRTPNDAESIVGVSRVAGQVAQQGNVGLLFEMFAFVNVFIGLLNLLPLPPFDGGHLAVLIVEKIRGRAVDARRLVPVSAVVLTFFVMFTLAVVILDLVKPIQLRP
jgi:membrane-associated protease RseP (regulator of RpoE activity)